MPLISPSDLGRWVAGLNITASSEPSTTQVAATIDVWEEECAGYWRAKGYSAATVATTAIGKHSANYIGHRTAAQVLRTKQRGTQVELADSLDRMADRLLQRIAEAPDYAAGSDVKSSTQSGVPNRIQSGGMPGNGLTQAQLGRRRLSQVFTDGGKL